MFDSTYTGPPPNDFATSAIHALRAEGFKVVPTQKSTYKGSAETLNISWRGVCIGKMRADLWEGRRNKRPYIALYMFERPTPSLARAKAPHGFDKAAFAGQHRCDPDRLHLNPEADGSYLWIEDQATCLLLMRDWAKKIDEVLFPSAGSREAAQIRDDVRAVLEDKSKSETQRRAEVDARLGQGKFRADLMKEFENACAATRLGVPQVLRASHILPWRDSDDDQRLDPKNGLLLSANLDALFDRYMITFRSDGKLEFSASITQDERGRLGPASDLHGKPCDKRAAFLRLHNAKFDQLEKKRLKYSELSESNRD
jgi:hypothetical protein